MFLWMNDGTEEKPIWTRNGENIPFFTREPFCDMLIPHLEKSEKSNMIVLDPNECAVLNRISWMFIGPCPDLFLDAMVTKALFLHPHGQLIRPPLIVRTVVNPNVLLINATYGEMTVGIRHRKK